MEANIIEKSPEQIVLDFLFEEIFARYGTLKEIVSDGGAQFTTHSIAALMEKYGIKNRVTSPYHHQVNGQVESTNKVLENILIKTIANHHQNWVEKLPEALWAYRTTWQNTTRFSPYKLVCGKFPLFPMEFVVKTLKTTLEVGRDLTAA